MRIHAQKAIISMILLLATVFNFAPASKAKAENVSFRQSILPARFVYLNLNGEIEKIWSNVSAKDGVYAIKFYNVKNRTEIKSNKKIIRNYQEIISKGELILESFLADDRKNDYLKNHAVDFIQRNGSLEEVHTYI